MLFMLSGCRQTRTSIKTLVFFFDQPCLSGLQPPITLQFPLIFTKFISKILFMAVVFLVPPGSYQKIPNKNKLSLILLSGEDKEPALTKAVNRRPAW